MSQARMRYAEAALAPLDRPLPEPPKPRAKPIQHEQQIQSGVATLLRLYEKQRRLAWWVIPNGLLLQGTKEQRARRAKYLIDHGMMRPGAVDLGLCLAPTGRCAVVELKHGRNEATPAQVEFMAGVARAGGLWAVCWSVDDVKRELDAWLAQEARRHERQSGEGV